MIARKYFCLCLDPVHIGSGGYRLGAVDNTIVREPATGVPKIPGTSLAGAIRAYATYYLKHTSSGNAAKTGKDGETADSKINRYFGTTEMQGIVRIYDAQILLFPVPSSNGTIWVTTHRLLSEWVNPKDVPWQDSKKVNDEYAYIAGWSGDERKQYVDLGWVLLKVDNEGKGISQPDEKNELVQFLTSSGLDFVDKVVCVSERMFSNLVNDNLEVRTSVKIDPETGASKEKALFTYEAIPRGTVLAFEFTIDSNDQNECEGALQAIEGSFKYLELLGVGGMSTRGFGRVRIARISKSNGSKEASQND